MAADAPPRATHGVAASHAAGSYRSAHHRSLEPSRMRDEVPTEPELDREGVLVLADEEGSARGVGPIRATHAERPLLDRRHANRIRFDERIANWTSYPEPHAVHAAEVCSRDDDLGTDRPAIRTEPLMFGGVGVGVTVKFVADVPGPSGLRMEGMALSVFEAASARLPSA
jgi:hypothetical protein